MLKKPRSGKRNPTSYLSFSHRLQNHVLCFTMSKLQWCRFWKCDLMARTPGISLLHWQKFTSGSATLAVYALSACHSLNNNRQYMQIPLNQITLQQTSLDYSENQICAFFPFNIKQQNSCCMMHLTSFDDSVYAHYVVNAVKTCHIALAWIAVI